MNSRFSNNIIDGFFQSVNFDERFCEKQFLQCPNYLCRVWIFGHIFWICCGLCMIVSKWILKWYDIWHRSNRLIKREPLPMPKLGFEAGSCGTVTEITPLHSRGGLVKYEKVVQEKFLLIKFLLYKVQYYKSLY